MTQNCTCINPLYAELNPICHLLALIGAHHILHVSRIRVKQETEKRNKEHQKLKILYVSFLYRHLTCPVNNLKLSKIEYCFALVRFVPTSSFRISLTTYRLFSYVYKYNCHLK